MIVQIVTPAGGAPLTVPASQFVVRDRDNLPRAVGAEYGPEGSQAISVLGLPDFVRIMTVLGVPTTELIDPTFRGHDGMRIEIVDKVGTPPVRLPATRFVVYQDNATPVVAGAEFGSNREPTVAMVGMDRFEQVLRLLGVTAKVAVQTLQMPKPPPGARLVAGPKE
jgi:hypothetical protein